MSKKNRSYPAEFKTRVALDALACYNSLPDLASKYGVHVNQISAWKKQAEEQIAVGFSSRDTKDLHGCEGLHNTVGQLTAGEKEFFKQVFAGGC